MKSKEEIKIEINSLVEQLVTLPTGWVCPKCGTSHNPDEPICLNCNPMVTPNNITNYDSQKLFC